MQLLSRFMTLALGLEVHMTEFRSRWTSSAAVCGPQIGHFVICSGAYESELLSRRFILLTFSIQNGT